MTASAKIRFEIEDLAAPDAQKLSGCEIRKTNFYLVESETAEKENYNNKAAIFSPIR